MSGSLNNSLPNASNWRVPSVNIVNTPDATFTGTAAHPPILIGQIGESGTATPGAAVLAVNLSNVQALCGVSSMLTTQYKQFISVNPTATVYLLPQTHAPEGAVNQVQTITVVTTTATTGVLSLYVGGVVIPVAVMAGQTATQIATSITTAINQSTVPVTAASAAGVVTVTTNESGLYASVSIGLNYRGPVNNEITPAGVTVTIAETTPGSGGPVLPAGLGQFGELAFDFIVNPYTDAGNVSTVTSYLQETWGPTVEDFGQAWGAVQSDVSGLVTYGDALNDPYSQFIGYPPGPGGMPAYQWAAAYAGACSLSIANDPAGTLTDLDLNLLAPQSGTAFVKEDRNTLLFNGISTFNVVGGRVILERSVTTYKTDLNGIPDVSYLDTETVSDLTAVDRGFIEGLAPFLNGSKLYDNGTPIAYGQKGVTPMTILAAAIGIYATMASQGLVQDTATFNTKSTAVKTGPGTVSLNLAVTLADQLRMLNINVAFSK